MKSTSLARLSVVVLTAAGFALAGWHLLSTAPKSKRQRPAAPIPLVDVIDSTPRNYPLSLKAAGPVSSAYELDIRPQVGGRIVHMHPEFEPGGIIPANSTLVQIDPQDYRLAVSAAEAEIAKARAAMTLEQGRRVVAREELESLQKSVKIDAASEALALRKPQLRQVQAELEAAENQLQRAQLDLQRTALALPFNVTVLERTRVSGEVVAAHELVGRVVRADEYWIELRAQPHLVQRLRVRDGDQAGSPVTVHAGSDDYRGEVVRIRAELAAGSRLAGVIAAVPIDKAAARQLLLGSYVEAEVAAGEMSDVVSVPRRAVRDNARVWVVATDGTLQVRDADIAWESGQRLLLSPDTLKPGDQIVVSRISGLVPGAAVRTRAVDPDTGQAVAMQMESRTDD